MILRPFIVSKFVSSVKFYDSLSDEASIDVLIETLHVYKTVSQLFSQSFIGLIFLNLTYAP